MRAVHLAGPGGAAAAGQLAHARRSLVPAPRIAEVLAAVAPDTIGVVPLEDSHVGLEAATVEGLVFDHDDLVVVAEVDRVDGDVTTRWIAVATEPLRAAVDPQTLLFVVPALNRPGTLMELLAAFSSRGLNLTRFATRPLGGALGMYGFLLEVEGSPIDTWMQDALADVLAASSHLKWLGTWSAGERVWSEVTGRIPAGTDMRTHDDLAALAARLEDGES